MVVCPEFCVDRFGMFGAALIAGFQMMSGQVPGDGCVKPSGGVAIGDCVDARPASRFPCTHD